MSQLAQSFHDYHSAEHMLILPNAWDAGSARVIENAGAKAIATSSAGVAWSLGYPDGNAMPVDQLASVVANITDIVRCPVSVDFEAGYSDDPAQVAGNAEHIIASGAVGINIEDGQASPEWLVAKIERIRKAASRLGVNLFINARTDMYWGEIGPIERRLEETLARGARYHAAGANGFFVPGLTDLEAIKTVVSEIKLPLNLLASPKLPGAKQLSELGVRRLSAGSAILRAAWHLTADLAVQFLKSDDSAAVPSDTIAYAKVQELFSR